MKKTFILLCFLIILTSFNIQNNYIEPTGTYKLNRITKKDGNDTYGYFGKIQVKKLSSRKIIMTFDVCKGAPSYNSGSFVDTLIYKNNRAVYTTEFDSTCKITFDFNKKGIIVKEKADLNSGCGFGQAVFADGFYKKVSSKVPILTEEKLYK